VGGGWECGIGHWIWRGWIARGVIKRKWEGGNRRVEKNGVGGVGKGGRGGGVGWREEWTRDREGVTGCGVQLW